MWNVFHPYLTSAIFSPLDFCLWGYLKSKVNSPRPATLNELQANIVREVAQVDPAMTMRAMLDMRERAVKCIGAGGGHFVKWNSDHLYPCLVTERSLMISWRNVVQNGHICMLLTCCKSQVHWNTLSQGNTAGFVKQIPYGFLTNQSYICHS